jgi:uncharacterized protein YqeY
MLLTDIRADLDAARKEKNQTLLTLLTTLYSECAMVGKTKRNGDSTDEEVLSIIRKFKIGVEEIAKIKGINTDIEYELSVYEKYLPSMISDEELLIIIDEIVNSLAEKSPKQMGKVMTELKNKYLGRYDGTLASKIVKEKLV